MHRHMYVYMCIYTHAQHYKDSFSLCVCMFAMEILFAPVYPYDRGGCNKEQPSPYRPGSCT